VPVWQTLEDPKQATPTPRLLLTYVLSYDDLAAETTRTLALDDDCFPLGIGRGEGALELRRATRELAVPDAWLSGAHARLERSAGGVVVHDLGSRNGTWVNGRRVTEHRLASGDCLEVGHSLLVFRVADDAGVAALAAAPRLGPTRTFAPATALLVRDLERIARSREPVLLLAETGAGKEVAATMVHERSGRPGPYVAIDCGAVPESLFEATFFGHRKGAFTGAAATLTGEIERADGGTLLLDEVGNMSPACQAKLLRVIEEGRFTPLGAGAPVRVDVRWLAATNRDVLADPAGFRPDLLRRLASFVGRLPPLRERREDLGALTAHLLADAGVRRAAITTAAGRLLYASSLPGNIRQLRTVLRSATALAAGATIDVGHLGPLEALEPRAAPAGAGAGAGAGAEPEGVPARGRATAPPPDALAAALAAVGGNVVQAARALDTHPRQIYRWLERYGLDLERYRGGGGDGGDDGSASSG
jgi:transcriptional regulator of acetoin/glycerol metabolism